MRKARQRKVKTYANIGSNTNTCQWPQAVWLQNLSKNEDGMTRVLFKWLPKRKELNRIRLILTYLKIFHICSLIYLQNNRGGIWGPELFKWLTQFPKACNSRSIHKPTASDSRSQDFSRMCSLGKSVSLKKKDGSSCQNWWKSLKLFTLLCSDSIFTQQLPKFNSIAQWVYLQGR